MNVDRFLDPDPQQLVEELKGSTNKRFRKLNKALAQLVSISLVNLEFCSKEVVLNQNNRTIHS